jgi:glucose-1-phosphate adenylyltransferase
MKDVLGIILGGGRGSRLYPLTRDRAKPAVPLAGKYRMIDIPMSNCFHSGVDKIAITTQFNSVSLHRHIYRTYQRDVFSRGWVQVLAAEQSPDNQDWYQGSADAVRKQLRQIRDSGARWVLILAGDHLYRMDYRRFVRHHIASGAMTTMAVHPASRAAASSLGILTLDPAGRVARYQEKPSSDSDLDSLISQPDPERPYLASMGVYVFNMDALVAILEQSDSADFGAGILPVAVETEIVFGYQFNDYWEDIGTIRRFYDAHMQLASPAPPFDFFSPDWPIHTRPRFLPNSVVRQSMLDNALFADGCLVRKASVRHSVVGLRGILDEGATLDRTVYLGADFYETESERRINEREGRPAMGIGAGSSIEDAILDKNVRIGRRVQIRSIPDRPDEEHPNWVSREGIVVVPKNAVLPDDTVI